MAPRLLFVMLGAVFYLGMTANGEPRQKASLKSVHIISDIKYRFATTLVSMKYYNPYNSSVSADLNVLMPRNSFISNFSMEIDGHVTVGEVKEKSVAKAIYENSVEKGQSAGTVEVKHRFTNVFDISVNVEPQKYIVYNLTYQELLTRENDKYRHVIHLSNGGIIDDFLVEIFIREPQDIIDVLVPEITDDKLTDIAVDKELDSALIKNISSREIYIKYNPSRKQQEEISEKDGAARFLRVEYDVDRQYISNSLYKATLKSIHVISDIKYRFATTLVSMKYYNPHNSSVTADLNLLMPRNSFISNFSMETDGHVTVGEVKEKSLAKDIYEYTRETGQSSASVEVGHRFTNVFDISVNVEPQKYIVYNLTYQELLTRQNNKYRHAVHVTNGEIIDDFLVEVFITEPQDIIHVSVPKITDNKLTDIAVDKELDSALITNISSREVYIKYNPSRKQQEEIKKDGVAGLLRVEYDVDRQNNSNLIYAVDGFFVHFFTPDSLPSLSKHIVFMLDVSASMSGRKIEQMSEAMENILDQLDPELDKFLIGKFSSGVSWMKDEFLIANNLNKNLGKHYIKNLQATGSTNINAALLQSVEKHKATSTPTKKSIIVFLTNGYPTEGVTKLKEIKKNFREVNEEISLFTLCFGRKSINNFFRELATENGGFNRRIYADSDSKLQIENFYKEISNILLKDITFVYLDGVVNTSSTSFSNYFKGSESVVSGVLPQNNHSTINVNLTMTNHLGPTMENLELELYRDDFTSDDGFSQNYSLTSIQSFSEITEKTYAYLTLRQLLIEDKTNEVRYDILNLALKYNFVTPLTSMVVTKYNVNEELFEKEYLPSRFENQAIVIHVKDQEPEFYPEAEIGRDSVQDIGHGSDIVVVPEAEIAAIQFVPEAKFVPEAEFYILPEAEIAARHFVPEAEFYILPEAEIGVQPTSLTHTSHQTVSTTAREFPLFIFHSPGILIKPLNCLTDLCFTDSIQCRNQTEIFLLADEEAGVNVYGHVKKTSDTNCLETLNRIDFSTPDFVASIQAHPQGQTDIPRPSEYQFSPRFSITVSQYQSANAETFLSVHFNILGKFVRAGGILSDYVTEFQCIEKPPNLMVLSNKAGLYNEVIYLTPTGSLSYCFTRFDTDRMCNDNLPI
ncbi:inter-alpha-trypsin inhibitor heavy chain H4-like [Octopus sinensis]|uniref:Inter-alpha-trypsin inhibitor heavy chain H4-like n=1 Tax=Octopus sinensis TaxID=2607531 RepID=A0A7E6EUV4_9MOLL|nr:inter-alpha-trypsin inhibitor heavy chain H4-like [Octopus sinensis]